MDKEKMKIKNYAKAILRGQKASSYVEIENEAKGFFTLAIRRTTKEGVKETDFIKIICSNSLIKSDGDALNNKTIKVYGNLIMNYTLGLLMYSITQIFQTFQMRNTTYMHSGCNM